MNTLITEPLTYKLPRLGFLGVGWIGQNRLQAIQKTNNSCIANICDSVAETAQKAAVGIENCEVLQSYSDMLNADLDGIVIATPSAEHAKQVRLALQKKKAVFVQKPLALDAETTRELVYLAKENDCLLKVDFSYRFTKAMQAVKKVLESGETGTIFNVELIFHNAYGPDKEWYYDVARSGGGCMTDLGIHLIDLLYWIFPEAEVKSHCSHLFKNGSPLQRGTRETEDFATSCLMLNNDINVNLASSWNLNAGREAIIEARFYGTKGGVQFRNINGSFYDFEAAVFTGTHTQIVEDSKDDWGGRAGVKWAEQLRQGNKYDPSNTEYIKVAETLDMIYGNL